MIYLAVAALVALLLILSAAYYFSGVAILPKTYDYDETYNIEESSGKLIKDKFHALKKEEFYLDSPFGYKLHCIFFPNGQSNKTMIFAHGITYTLYGSVKYMDMFLKRGFNVLIYDHRFHGKSGGKDCTFGYYEKQDLKTCTSWVVNKIGQDSIVGIHGESMGAATALQNSEIDPRVAFYIADCPYSDLMKLLTYRLKIEYKLPAFPLINLASIIAKMRCGTAFSAVSPIKAISKVQTPILFIHGQKDAYIPKEMSIDMYNTKPGHKKLYLAPEAGHAEAYWKNQEEYAAKVGEFLKEIGIE